MARTEARVKTSIWRDQDWLDLDPLPKLTYLTVLSQPALSLCGVIPYTPGAWANGMKSTQAKARAACAVLVDKQFALIDTHTEELWVRSFIKNDGILTKPYMVIAMAKDVCSVRSSEIRGQILDSLGPGFVKGLPEQFPNAFAGEDPKHLPDAFVELFAEWFAKGFYQ